MRRLFEGMALGTVLLTGCGGNDAGQQANPTTTSTTLADPATGRLRRPASRAAAAPPASPGPSPMTG
jgi:hypothetical protein